MEQINPIHRLSFSVEVNTLELDHITTQMDYDGDGTYPTCSVPVALVRLLINGVEPLRSTYERPLDAVEVLAEPEKSEERFFYTCSCGQPGCASLFEGIHVNVAAHTVRMRFPSNTYALMLAPEFKPAASTEGAGVLSQGGADLGEADFVAVFDKDQYLEAIRALEQELKDLSVTYPHLQAAPTSTITDSLEEVSFLRTLANVRAYLSAEASRIAFAQETLGEFADQDIRISAPEGEFLLSAYSWQGLFTGLWLREPFNDEQKEALKEAARRVTQPGMTCRGFLLTLDWERICEQVEYLGQISFDASDENAGLEPCLAKEPSQEYLERLHADWVRST